MILITGEGFLDPDINREFVDKGQEAGLLSCIQDHRKSEVPSFPARWMSKRARKTTGNLEQPLIPTLVARHFMDNIFRPVERTRHR